jgi:putative SOS response-associated peptidase YedK
VRAVLSSQCISNLLNRLRQGVPSTLSIWPAEATPNIVPAHGVRSRAGTIAWRDGAPFGIAGIWENWRDPTVQWQRTFAILTVPANELVAQIHDRMPVILRPEDYERWLGDEPDPRNALTPFPSDLLRMRPISTRVNKPENDDPTILDPIAGAGPGAFCGSLSAT